MSKSRVKAYLLDADGCTYNPEYHYRLVITLNKYFDFLQRYGHRKHSRSHSAQFLDHESIKQQVDVIEKDILSAEYSLPDYVEASEQLTEKVKAMVLRKRDIARRKLKGLFSESEVEQYAKKHSPMPKDNDCVMIAVRSLIGQANLIDPRILGAIMVSANKSLVNMCGDVNGYDKVVFMLGSARQDYHHDMLGMRENGTNSAMRDLLYLANHIKEKYQLKNVEINRLTQADIHNFLKDGEAFNLTIANNTKDHPRTIYDETKLTILYSAMHSNMLNEIAAGQQEVEVDLDFFDDRMDILEPLLEFFKRHPDLCPENVSTRLIQYKDGQARLIDTIDGIGVVNEKFRESILHMYSLCKLQNNKLTQQGIVDAARMLSPEEVRTLHNSLIEHDAKSISVLLDADGCVYNYKYSILVMTIIKQFAKDIRVAALQGSENNKAILADELTAFIREYDFEEMHTMSQQRLAQFLNLTMDKAIDVFDDDILHDETYNPKERSSAIIRQFVRYLQVIDPKIIDEALFKANAHLFKSLMREAHEQECDYINVMVGSNRQCYRDDSYNSRIHGTRSYYYDLERLVNLCNQRLDGKIAFKLDRFLMADVYSALPAGSSYYKAIKSSDGDSHPVALWDGMKVSLVYAYLHHIAMKHKGSKHVYYIDDRDDIFQAIFRSYATEKNHLLLPEVAFKMVQYYGDQPDFDSAIQLKGGGDVDTQVYHSVHIMATLGGVRSIRDLQKGITVSFDQIDFKRFAELRGELVVIKDNSLTLSRRTYKPKLISSCGIFKPKAVAPQQEKRQQHQTLLGGKVAIYEDYMDRLEYYRAKSGNSQFKK